MTLAALAPAPGWKDTIVRAAKTAVQVTIGILGLNAANYTSIPALKAAALAGAAAAVSIILNKILAWTATP